MLRDCLNVFAKEMQRTADQTGNPDGLILDSYIPAEGDYLIVKDDGTIDHKTIRMNKKTRELDEIPLNYEQLCFYDYHSKLVSMDKPQDPKKVIHSNNYLSFWVKQENLKNGKLDEAAIDRYFDVLADPRAKYSKTKDRQMYDYIAGQIGDVDQSFLERNRAWIKKNVFSLEEKDVVLTGRNYLKIFFEAPDDLYLQEESRYQMTKIFNKNDYNVKIQDQIKGLPNDNLGMNSKKPYVEHRTRKQPIPYLISSEEAILQKKFFDFLMNKANAGEINVFFDTTEGRIVSLKKGKMLEEDFSGFFLQIQKGKEVIIQHQDVIVDYRSHLWNTFTYENILQTDDKENLYKEYRKKEELQAVIDDVIFSKWLIGNYFTPADELAADGEIKRNLIWARDAIFAWLYKGKTETIDRILNMVCMNMVKSSIRNGFLSKAKKQFNLMQSFDRYFNGGDQKMVDYIKIKEMLRQKISQKDTSKIETDEEYFYAVGQLVNYFISLSRSNEKTHALANPFFNAKTNEWIQTKLRQYFIKYDYQLKHSGRRFNNLYAMICGYTLKGSINQNAMICGYLNSNLIYESNKDEVKKG